MTSFALFFGTWAIKAVLVSIAGIVVAMAQDRTIAGNRHLALAGTLLMLALLPLAMAVIPPLKLAVLPATTAVQLDRVIRAAPALPPASIIAPIASWLAVAFALAAHRMRVVRNGLAMARRSRPADAPITALCAQIASELGIVQLVRVSQSRELATPATVGWRRPVVLLPANANDWPRPQLQHALLHELCHIRRGDWLLTQTARLVCAAYWPLPAVWWICRRLEQNAELACDQLVVAEGADQLGYARDLVRTCRFARALPTAVSMGGAGELAARIRSLVHGERYRIPVYRELAILYVAFFALPLLLLAAAVPVARPLQAATATGAPIRLVRLGGLTGGVHLKPPSKLVDTWPAPSPVTTPPVVSLKSTEHRRPALLRPKLSDDQLPHRIGAAPAAVSLTESRAVVIAMPDYPNTAARAAIGGKVVVRYRVDARGNVNDAIIAHARPPGIFDRAALKAVRAFRFRPATANGVAIDGRPGVVLFRFTSDSARSAMPARRVVTVQLRLPGSELAATGSL